MCAADWKLFPLLQSQEASHFLSNIMKEHKRVSDEHRSRLDYHGLRIFVLNRETWLRGELQFVRVSHFILSSVLESECVSFRAETGTCLCGKVPRVWYTLTELSTKHHLRLQDSKLLRFSSKAAVKETC